MPSAGRASRTPGKSDSWARRVHRYSLEYFTVAWSVFACITRISDKNACCRATHVERCARPSLFRASAAGQERVGVPIAARRHHRRGAHHQSQTLEPRGQTCTALYTSAAICCCVGGLRMLWRDAHLPALSKRKTPSKFHLMSPAAYRTQTQITQPWHVQATCGLEPLRQYPGRPPWRTSRLGWRPAR